jgi:hypothetical protein
VFGAAEASGGEDSRTPARPERRSRDRGTKSQLPERGTDTVSRYEPPEVAWVPAETLLPVPVLADPLDVMDL